MQEPVDGFGAQQQHRLQLADARAALPSSADEIHLQLASLEYIDDLTGFILSRGQARLPA